MPKIFQCPDCGALVSGDGGVRLHGTWHEREVDPLTADELDVQNWPNATVAGEEFRPGGL